MLLGGDSPRSRLLMGTTVSHSTLNRIRRGTYGSVPTESVLKAVAYLAGVPEERVLSAPDASAGRRPDAIFDDWQRAKAKVLNLEIEYAMARDIPIDEAEEELSHVLQMVFDTRVGRPWTPPWQPGDAFDPDDEPWKAEWWATSTPISAADRFEEAGIGTPETLARLRNSNQVIHRVSLGWNSVDDYGGLDGFLKWKRQQQQENTGDITAESSTEPSAAQASENEKAGAAGRRSSNDAQPGPNVRDFMVDDDPSAFGHTVERSVTGRGHGWPKSLGSTTSTSPTSRRAPPPRLPTSSRSSQPSTVDEVTFLIPRLSADFLRTIQPIVAGIPTERLPLALADVMGILARAAAGEAPLTAGVQNITVEGEADIDQTTHPSSALDREHRT